MTPVNFTHTQFNTEVTIYAELVYAVMTAPTLNSTVLVSTGGASVPVTDTVAVALSKLNAAKAPPNQGAL
jgi:acyl-CoA synthetase (NDP forming)